MSVTVNLKTWLEKRNKLVGNTSIHPISVKVTNFSIVEQTVSASKCGSSEEPGLQAIELRPAKAHHPVVRKN